MSGVQAKAEAARRASIKMATLDSEFKNRALLAAADAVWRGRGSILEANRRDLAAAEALLREGRYSEALVKRLALDEAKLQEVVEMMRSVASLEDPAGRTEYAVELDRGLELFRVTCPIGVVGVVFESRPDALAQIASLCLKSGNAAIMKGGREARHSNEALYVAIRGATAAAGVPEGWIQLIEAREEVAELLKLDGLVSLIVPRGGKEFIQYVLENTRIPVLGHAEGVCHIYVDERADLGKAVEVCHDAKVQYPAVCNAVDALLVHRDVAERFLPLMAERYERAHVEMRGCPETRRILGDRVREASQGDWGYEYLDLIVAIKVVGGIEEAVDHVNTYGSHHTDAIVTEDAAAARMFMSEVDSAGVFWNASTRFSDGYRYGLGAEVGISTGKIHARGPTGLEGLTIYKYYLVGSGQVVADYTDGGARRFTHRRLSKGWKDLW